jgi:hypothetical protein
MIDRTKELQMTKSEWESLRETNKETDIEMGNMEKTTSNPFHAPIEADDQWMESFFSTVRSFFPYNDFIIYIN